MALHFVCALSPARLLGLMILPVLLTACATPRVVNLNAASSQSTLMCARVQTQSGNLEGLLLNVGHPVRFVYSIRNTDSDRNPLQANFYRPAELEPPSHVPMLSQGEPEYFCTPNAPPGWHAYIAAGYTTPSFSGMVLFDGDGIKATTVEVPEGAIVYMGTVNVVARMFASEDDAQRHYRATIVARMKANGTSSLNPVLVQLQNAPAASVKVSKPSRVEMQSFMEFLDKTFRPLGWSEQIDRFKAANP